MRGCGCCTRERLSRRCSSFQPARRDLRFVRLRLADGSSPLILFHPGPNDCIGRGSSVCTCSHFMTLGRKLIVKFPTSNVFIPATFSLSLSQARAAVFLISHRRAQRMKKQRDRREETKGDMTFLRAFVSHSLFLLFRAFPRYPLAGVLKTFYDILIESSS